AAGGPPEGGGPVPVAAGGAAPRARTPSPRPVLHHACSPSLDSGASRPWVPVGRSPTAGRSRLSSFSGDAVPRRPLVAARRILLLRPGSMLPVRALDFWLATLGSVTEEIT